MTCCRLVLLPLAIIINYCTVAQGTDSLFQKVSSTYIAQASAQSTGLEKKLAKKSARTIAKFKKQEMKLQHSLALKDSSKAAAVFGDAAQQYDRLEQRIRNVSSKQYIPSLDTLASSLQFLQQNPQLLAKVKGTQEKLTAASQKVKALESQFQQAEEIKKFLKERREYLKAQLGQMNFTKQFKQLGKQAYYYQVQVSEYKELLKDHTKAEKKALELLSKTKLFKDFMRKNSQLASLFRLPGDPDDPAAQANLAGLQTRAQVTSLIDQQIGAGGPNAQAQFQQNMQSAQSQVNQLKEKVLKGSGGSSDDILPEGFKPNNQRTKSFLQRLELGTNIQSQRASGFFPTSSDIGISLGYKLNDKSIIGIGGSYRMGWGKDIRHIHISHQGIGIGSFVDWKIKGSLWFSGGYEMNYRSEFKSIDELKDRSAWQQSGLIGVSKMISLKTKFFKKTKLQLLWDVLSYQQVPRTQSILVRVGFNLN